jgi:hypothetical protein
VNGSEPAAPDLRSSLLRHLGIAAGVIVLVAGAFWAVGLVGDDEPSLVVADAPDDTEDAAEEPAGDPPPEEDEPDEPEPADEEPAEEAADEPAEPEPADEEPADEADEVDEVEEEPVDEAASDDEEPEPEPEPAADRIDPASVTVQVLDGYRADGGAAARTVAATLRDGGYRVVAENPALAYEVTTVLFTAGQEAAARQVAADLGAPEVREKPANLSDQVAVHVVVGSDRA